MSSYLVSTEIGKMAASAERFAELSEEEIKCHLENKTSKNTKKATQFGMKVFDGKKIITSDHFTTV